MTSRRWQHDLTAWLLGRDRIVSKALQAYAAMTTSADRGTVRDLDQLKKVGWGWGCAKQDLNIPLEFSSDFC